MVDEKLLEILVCPENKTSLSLVGPDVIDKANALIESKRLKNRAGEVIEEKIEGGLLREDKAFMYPIREDIPIMLIDEAIPFEQIR